MKYFFQTSQQLQRVIQEPSTDLLLLLTLSLVNDSRPYPQNVLPLTMTIII